MAGYPRSVEHVLLLPPPPPPPPPPLNTNYKHLANVDQHYREKKAYQLQHLCRPKCYETVTLKLKDLFITGFSEVC